MYECLKYLVLDKNESIARPKYLPEVSISSTPAAYVLKG